MANRYAVATGVWSNPAIWDGGTLPGPGDVVRPNNFTVTIDQDITVDTLTNDASSPAAANGHFRLTNATTPGGGITLNCNLVYNNATFAYLVYIVDGILAPITINGDIVMTTSSTGSVWTLYQASNTHVFSTLTINGNITSSGATSSKNAVLLSGIFDLVEVTGDITTDNVGYAIQWSRGTNSNTTQMVLRVNGNVVCSGISSATTIMLTQSPSYQWYLTYEQTGNLINSSSGSGVALYFSNVVYPTTDDITIDGDVILSGNGTTLNVSASGYGDRNITITGDIICSNVGFGTALTASVTGRVHVVGNIESSEGKTAIYALSAKVRVDGTLTSGPNGWIPMCVRNFRTLNAGRVIWTMPEDDGTWDLASNTNALILSNYFPETPAPADVREGVVYGVSDELEGTLIVPNPATVSLGIPTDDTVGEAVLLIDSGIATIDSTGAQIAAALTS